MKSIPTLYWPVIASLIICLVGIIDWLFMAGKVNIGKNGMPKCVVPASLGWLMLAVLLAQMVCVGGMFVLKRKEVL
jgi:hypothetical protein